MQLKNFSLNKYIEYIVLVVLALIFTLYHAVLTSLIISTEAEVELSFLYVFVVEIMAFIPMGVTLLFTIYLSRKVPALFTSVTLKIVAAHTVIALSFFAIHAHWQIYVNSVFFDFQFTFEEVRSDFIGFLIMRFFAYIAIVGLVGGIMKLKEFQEKESKESKLRLELQKAKMKEMELKLNPEIIYPNLAYIKEKAESEPESASQMVILMAGLLRKLVDNLESERIYISDDIKYFQSYISMISLRLEKSYETNFKLMDVNENTQVLSILLIIPLIEQFFFGAYSQYFEEVDSVKYLAKRSRGSNPVIELSFYGIPDVEGLTDYLTEDPLVKTTHQMLKELTEGQCTFTFSAKVHTLSIMLSGFKTIEEEVVYV